MRTDHIVVIVLNISWIELNRTLIPPFMRMVVCRYGVTPYGESFRRTYTNCEHVLRVVLISVREHRPDGDDAAAGMRQRRDEQEQAELRFYVYVSGESVPVTAEITVAAMNDAPSYFIAGMPAPLAIVDTEPRFDAAASSTMPPDLGAAASEEDDPWTLIFGIALAGVLMCVIIGLIVCTVRSARMGSDEFKDNEIGPVNRSPSMVSRPQSGVPDEWETITAVLDAQGAATKSKTPETDAEHEIASMRWDFPTLAAIESRARSGWGERTAEEDGYISTLTVADQSAWGNSDGYLKMMPPDTPHVPSPTAQPNDVVNQQVMELMKLRAYCDAKITHTRQGSVPIADAAQQAISQIDAELTSLTSVPATAQHQRDAVRAQHTQSVPASQPSQGHTLVGPRYATPLPMSGSTHYHPGGSVNVATLGVQRSDEDAVAAMASGPGTHYYPPQTMSSVSEYNYSSNPGKPNQR